MRGSVRNAGPVVKWSDQFRRTALCWRLGFSRTEESNVSQLDLQGRHAVVPGAAAGIGLAIARRTEEGSFSTGAVFDLY
jgi:hypothetical protein